MVPGVSPFFSIPCLCNCARNLQQVLEELTWGRSRSCPHLRRECVEVHSLEIRLVCFALMAGCHSFLLAALLDHCSQACRLPFSSQQLQQTHVPAHRNRARLRTVWLSRQEKCWHGSVLHLPLGCSVPLGLEGWQEMGFCAETICCQISPAPLAYSVYSPSLSFKERLFLEVSFDLEVSVKPTIFNPYGMHHGMSWPDVSFPVVPTQRQGFIC